MHGRGRQDDERGDSLTLRTGIRVGRMLAAGLLACVFAGNAATRADDGAVGGADGKDAVVGAPNGHFETFLDRLMRAESNGRDFAANPRSTALGPFQFIKSTFLEVARRHFPELAELSDEDVLALRTNRGYARRAASIYCMESLAYLTGKGLSPTLGDLRLAYLVGPNAAARVLQAQPQTPTVEVLGAPVVKANPFMNGMSTSQLIARSQRDVGEYPRTSVAVAAPEPHARTVAEQPEPVAQPRPAARTAVAVARPAAKAEVAAACNRKLVSCRRWIALRSNKQRTAQQQTNKQVAPKPASANRRRVTGRSENRPGV
jgi:hypothetical protein